MDNFGFILSTTSGFFHCDQSKISNENSIVQEFLENEEQQIMSAYVNSNEGSIKFDHRIPNENHKILLFYKIHQKHFGNEKSLNLGMMTVEGGIVQSIYNSISSMMYHNELNKNDYNPELLGLIENLRSHISVSLGIAETGITSIQDEIQFWSHKMEKSFTKSDKEAAKIFAQHLEGLNKMIDDFYGAKSSQNLRNIEDLMDRVQYVLDEIWRLENFQYPQNRMVSLIDLLSSMIVQFCTNELNIHDILNLNTISVTEIINDVIDILNNWNSICDSLTRLFWTNCGSHLWTGPPYISSLVEKLRKRIEEILDIWKKVHQQLIVLSGEDDTTMEQKPKNYFVYFEDIDIFDISPIGDKYWKNAKNKFEHSLSAIEQKIATNIKLSIQTSINNPQEIVNIFSQFENILKSTKIKNSLKIECNHLFEAVKLYINKLEKSLNAWKRKPPDDDGTDEVSNLITEIKYLKVIEHQIEKLKSVSTTILIDHENHNELMKIVNDFHHEIDTSLKQNFSDWCENSLALISTGDLILKDNEPVVKFDTTDRQQMTATYSLKLVIFCHDISQLKLFGFSNIPNELLKYAVIAKKYIKYAKSLQQISNFHNTIGDKIIPCHRPIMLKKAIEFSNLVKSESVTWKDEESVEKYIKVLQSVINSLSNDLNLLTSHHEKIKISILKLTNTDILKQSSVWKDEMKLLRNYFVDLEKKGYTNLELFKVHWDYQLYKALEHQLISLLIDSREKLPDIHIDLVFRQQQLQFRPTMEEIRHEYFQQIKKYIEIPLSFQGFSIKSKDIFKVMVERNRSKFKSLYERAEQNFQRLHEFRDLWLPWVAIGCVNLENLCQVHLTTWEHWDQNFKSCKMFSQKIAKIQKSEERIDCLVVNVEPVRSHVEFMARSFWETLSISLRSSILEDSSVINEYISTSLNVLQHIPSDEAGIITASFKYDKIVADFSKMENLLKTINNKNTCLMGWCKESVGSIDSLISKWEKLLPLIENHDVLLRGQVETIKENLLTKINHFSSESEKYLIKFEDTLRDLQLNPEMDMENFVKRKNEWNEFLKMKDLLTEECETFNASSYVESLNEKFEVVVEKISKYEEDWVVFLDFNNELKEIEQESWSFLRRKPIFSEFLSKWDSKTNNINKIPAMRVKKQIEKFRQVLPLLTLLQTDSLSERHWADIFRIINMKPKSYYDIKLVDVLTNISTLVENSNEIKTIVHQANSEQIVRQAITELEQWSESANLKLFPYAVNTTETIYLIKDFQDILNKIGDNQCLLNTSKNTSAIENFMDQIELWENKLNLVSFILNNLNQIQKKWIYLEPIFSNGTFKTGESSFKRIDKDFRYIMQHINSNQKVISLIKINNIQMLIESSLNQLNQCQNTLAKYMSEKRDLFPRFYFLSDDDLLEILGQSEKENILQKHINKLFPGISKLSLTVSEERNVLKINGITSNEFDETIQLSDEIPMKNAAVEDFLNKLDNEIKKTLKSLIHQCFYQNEFSIETIEKYPMQVLCLVRSIHFTAKIEKSINTMSLPSLLDIARHDVEKYSTLLQKCSNETLRAKIRALLIDMVHQVTTVDYLIKHNVTNFNDWHWLQQIKFYYNPKNESVSIKMVKAEFEYSYEFLGHYNKLVYTALTHNCYLTLTQAMGLGLGAQPFGPAGTGKTECVKSLGAMMGRMVLVFNCNENIDTSAMALILTGISRCGAWACFDEFNRLQEDTLSAIAMLIQPLQTAVKEKRESVQLLNVNIQLNRHSSIFVTLNPVHEDYGGRNQLPTNLQSLFRPIIMKQPEPSEIAKVMLFIEGFKHAEEIGRRIVELFNLSNKLLSTQRHYDWGLRELKTILIACGKCLRYFKSIEKGDEEILLGDEMKLVVQAIKPNVKSKLTLSDRKRFEMLLSDVFPRCDDDDIKYEDLKMKIVESMKVMGLVENERQVEKCIEIYEQLNKRVGVALFGPTNSGKSTCISILKSAFSLMSQTIRTYVISPKSMSRSKLLGHLDLDTRQWHDGVLTQTAVAVNSEPNEVNSWIICDGDVDPEWIEALNSVLDDNKLLTLPSGWRIQFGNNVNFIFETHDFSHASPATISRMGIIHFSSEELTYQILIEPYIDLKSNSDTLKIFFETFYDKVFFKLNQFSNLCKRNMISPVTINKAILNCLSNSIESKEEFIVELVRACNLLIDADDRNAFTNSVLDEFNIYITNVTQAEFVYFNKFRKHVETYSSDDINEQTSKQKNFLFETSAIKSTKDSLRNILKNDNCPPFTLVGPHGSGKFLMIDSVVSEITGYQLIPINCSAQLTPQDVLDTLKHSCLIISGFKGKEYKPKQSRLILLFKNIDLCSVDSWGTCDVIELLLQIMNRNGFYGDNLEWISVSGLHICATLSDIKTPKISPRFLSKNVIILNSSPSSSDMLNIITNFLNIYETSSMEKNSSISKENLCRVIFDCFNDIKSNFSTEMCHHYQFNPKMIEMWISGMSHYKSEDFMNGFFYEFSRIFGDRLKNIEHHQIFKEIVDKNARSFHSTKYDDDETFFTIISEKSGNLQLTSQEEWKNSVEKNILMCNTETSMIESPLTNEFLRAIASVLRALSRQGNNICITGKLGAGRFDSVAVACTMLNIKLMFPNITQTYTSNDFINDLKIVMQICGLEDKVVVFYIDHINVNYLSDIMKICEAVLEGGLNNYKIFGDDLENVASALKSAAQLEGYQDSLSTFFMERVKKNLHLVVALESTSSTYNDIIKTHKCLFEKTEFIWLKDFAWKTKENLYEKVVELMKLQLAYDLSTESLMPFRHFTSIIEICELCVDSPKRFIQLIKSYLLVYNSNEKLNVKQMEKLECGIQKLSDAYKFVAKLKDDAKEKEDALAEKRSLAKQALEMITHTMKSANDQKLDMLKLKTEIEEKNEILKERKIEIEKELSLVEPLLKEASAAVGSIKSEALSEIRSLRAPPEIIRDILEGVLRLMGIRDTSWNSMKSFLAKRGVKEDIRSLNPSLVSPENCAEVERLIAAKSDSFDFRTAKRASSMAAPLAGWVVACVKYCQVFQSIKPLEREQKDLQRNLESTEIQMKSLSTGIDDVNSKVKELSEQLNVYTQEAAVLEIKLEDTRKILKSTELLVEKLSSEYESWSYELEGMRNKIKNIDNESMMIALCLTHFSHLSEEERQKSIQKCTDMLNCNFQIHGTLFTDQDKLIWESFNLLPDNQSSENASALVKLLELPYGLVPVPLLLDQTGNTLKWLTNFMKNKTKRTFEILHQSSERFTFNIELGVRFGKTLIIQDIKSPMSSCVLSLLRLKIHCQFGKKFIHIGNKFIDFHEDFRLILVTNNNNLKSLDGDVNANVTIIPFTLTVSSLTDQLLSKWIALKNPESDKKRIELLESEGKLTGEKTHLQEKLLEELTHAEGDILKNEKLLSTLNDIKEKSLKIETSLAESSQIRMKLIDDYVQFKDICQKSSSFFINLSKIYRIDYESFTRLFLNAFGRQSEIEEFSTCFKDLVRKTFYLISRSIKESEHPQLLLNIIHCAYPAKIPDVEWELFIYNFAEAESSEQNKIPTWIKKNISPKISTLKSRCPQFYTNLDLDNENDWQNFIHATEDVYKKFPNTTKLTEFQRILTYQIFRPDHLLPMIKKISSEFLGIKDDSFHQQKIKQLLSEEGTEPILIISPGSVDPTSEIVEFAKQLNISFNEIFIGEERQEEIYELLQKSASKGGIVCFKNVHLRLQIIEKNRNILKSLNSIHQNFRVIYICENDKNLSTELYQECKVFVMEPPSGIKFKILSLLELNLKSLRDRMDSRQYKIYVALFILHSVMLERRNFIPNGWCKFYDFCEADLKASIDFFGILVGQSSSNIDWIFLRGFLEKIIYGGRVESEQDFEKLILLIREHFNEKILHDKWNPKFLNIQIPNYNRIEDYQNVLMKIESDPNMLGLSQTAIVSKNITTCKILLKDLRKAHVNIDDTDSIQRRIKPLLILWKKLSQNFSLPLLEDLKCDEDFNNFSIFKISEMKFAHGIVKMISETLIKFISIDSNSLSTADKNLLLILCDNSTPLEWKKFWQGPKIASEYLKAVASRVANAVDLTKQINDPINEIDFGLVFKVDSFLSTLKMLTSKNLQIAPNNLILESFCDTKYYEKFKSEFKNIIKVHPLTIDGLPMENNYLVRDGSLQNLSCPFYIFYRENQNSSLHPDEKHSHKIPMYSTLSRDEILCNINLNSLLQNDEIIYSGTALVVINN